MYPTEHGPMMYYEGKEYVLHKGLHITLRIDGKEREFIIEEYNIKIKYLESPYIGIDVWSSEEDVDLFYQIAQFYQDDEYYKKYIYNEIWMTYEELMNAADACQDVL